MCAERTQLATPGFGTTAQQCMNPVGRQGPGEMLQTVQCNHAALVGTDVTTTVELTLALATPPVHTFKSASQLSLFSF